MMLGKRFLYLQQEKSLVLLCFFDFKSNNIKQSLVSLCFFDFESKNVKKTLVSLCFFDF